MLSFIQKNIRKYSDLIKPILNASNLTVMDLLLSVRRHKKEVNSINYLKLIWGHVDKSDPIFKCIRILSYVFMRKHCLEYIFNSRIKNYSTHIKYRKRIMEGIQNTTEFTCIKQFWSLLRILFLLFLTVYKINEGKSILSLFIFVLHFFEESDSLLLFSCIFIFLVPSSRLKYWLFSSLALSIAYWVRKAVVNTSSWWTIPFFTW